MNDSIKSGVSLAGRKNAVMSSMPNGIDSNDKFIIKSINNIYDKLIYCNNEEEWQSIKRDVEDNPFISVIAKSYFKNNKKVNFTVKNKNNLSCRDLGSSLCSQFGLNSVLITCSDDMQEIQKAVFEIRSGLSAFCHVTGIDPKNLGGGKLKIIINQSVFNTESIYDQENSSIEIFNDAGDIALALFSFIFNERVSDSYSRLVLENIFDCSSNKLTSPVVRKNIAIAQSAILFKKLISSVSDDESSAKLFRRYRLFQKWRDDFSKGCSLEQVLTTWNRWRTGNKITMSSIKGSDEFLMNYWLKEEKIIDGMLFKKCFWLTPSWIIRLIPDFVTVSALSKNQRVKIIATSFSEVIRHKLGRDTWLVSHNHNAPIQTELQDVVNVYNSLTNKNWQENIK